ncbi:MAG TPA: beta-mannosidase [Fibrobacteres bacterium]|jgi:mannan endo-1,4-beta-mannosidase|nr:beta-mannosidase [Fibrobacterota bacterium]
MKIKALLFVVAGLSGIVAAADRYEAESAIVDENSVTKIADTSASGGYYVNMEDGNLKFKVTVATTGYYTLWVYYSQPFDTNGKIQNLTVNGSSKGQISFPYTEKFVYMKASAKIKLAEGIDTIGIVKSWGWVNLDYIELTSYESTPFNITSALVTPNASISARKMFSFLLNNFQKKIISGVMTNTVMQNDGKYTPDTVENQTEVAWIDSVSGKVPALIGLDFMHAAGYNDTNEWHRGYTRATLSLARTVFKKGGIPAYCWHWKDPNDSVEAFYSPSSGNSPFTTFDLNKAFKDSTTYAAFDSTSREFKGIIKALDTVAGYLKSLSDSNVAVLWRPLHESSGKWFWWGYKGPGACKALYRLMFDRFTNYHKLDNLIWVWTTDEASDALNWYPGDDYVDIVGRDYYYYPREANHGSLVASFEKLKEMYSGNKLVALSENGSVPYPDSMVADGAGWSYFMPWYGDYTMDGWAHDNTAADWKTIMNNDYVITLDKMPGWNKYVVSVKDKKISAAVNTTFMHYGKHILEFTQSVNSAVVVDLIGINGRHIANIHSGNLGAGTYRFDIKNFASGMYLVRVKNASGVLIKPVVVN